MFHSNALYSQPFFSTLIQGKAERVTFIQIHKSNQKVSLSGFRPNVSFTLFNVAFSKTIFIVRHRLAFLFVKVFLLMTLKLHEVAQLRCVELTSRAEKIKTSHSREGGNQALMV